MINKLLYLYIKFKKNYRSEMSNFDKVKKFMETFGQEVKTKPSFSTDKVNKLRYDLIKEELDELKEAMDHGLKESVIVEQTIGRYTELAENIRQKLSNISSNNSAVSRLQRQIQSYQDELTKKSDGDLIKANEELQLLVDDQNSIKESGYGLNENLLYNQVMAEMLKDTGIKTKVIKQYLPVINHLVNQYLQTLDFFVHFDLDESFQETIRSRHRDAFSYDSFSEGEKQRIDLALLFTWRQIAKMKNSVATNLLILDETFDSSLDHEGVDNLMKILYTLDDDTNVFVISHKGEILDGKFVDKLEFYKDKNFSKIK